MSGRILYCVSLLLLTLISRGQGEHVVKQNSTFYTERVLAAVRANVAHDKQYAVFARVLTEKAKPWRAMTDEQLWGLMFGPTLPRSWMVWSDGWCPACHKKVPMYAWKCDALAQPWKVTCPNCGEVFPKNDFGAYYRSGLDVNGIFDRAKADRTLLVNPAHPDAADPLHGYGVDDGEGYRDGEHRWRFIAAYLIYGQWRQAVLDGINTLAAAYVVTGERVYAHKAAILLDRVADLYPGFDYKTQGDAYERDWKSPGYVTMWDNACEETRVLALAYDMVFSGMRDDPELVAFLARMAKEHRLANPKATLADIDRNIAAGLLQDPLAHPEKIDSNFPRGENTKAILLAVQQWPGNRNAVMERMNAIVQGSTQVDGVTGEKGMANYSAYVIQSLASCLQQFTLAEPDFVKNLYARYPVLRQTYRFHIDTLCLDGYYPSCGDATWFAGRDGQYAGILFQPFGNSTLPDPPLEPSMFSFAWGLYRITGDPAYVQALYRANGSKLDGLPYDVTCTDAAAFRREVQAVIRRNGTAYKVASVNKTQWHLAILRAGSGNTARAAWLDYDWRGKHGHSDGMNLGLYAYGLDLLPDFGYPPVNYTGGWDSPQACWYRKNAAHHTVTVDNTDLTWPYTPLGGTTPLWADGKHIHAVRATAPNCYANTSQYERTVFLLDLTPAQSVLVDIMRVVGGKEQVMGVSSHFGTVTTQGLRLTEPREPAQGVLVRNLHADEHPAPGWSVEWHIEDRYHLCTAKWPVHLRYTGLSEGAEVQLGEAWVSPGNYNSSEETWVPRVLIRRHAAEALASTFVAVLEPFSGTRPLHGITRLPLTTSDGAPFGDNAVAVELTAADGARHLLISLDTENAAHRQPTGDTARQPDRNIILHGEAAWLQFDAAGKVCRAALFNGSRLIAPGLNISLPDRTAFYEVELVRGKWRVTGE